MTMAVSGSLSSASRLSDEASPSREKDISIRGATPDDAVSNTISTGPGTASAWMTVAGSWMILFASFGYLYGFGVYQDFYTRVYLTNHTTSQIAWIGSFQLAMPLLLGIVTGKLYDSGYYHIPQIFGATLFTVSLFMLSLAKPLQYYQIFLSQGVGMGFGVGFVFTPTLSNISHIFYEKKSRALASGVALSGTSVGALIFPILLNHLIPSIGFAKAVRASAYIVLGFLVIGNCLIRRSTAVHARPKQPVDVKSFFTDPAWVINIPAAIMAVMGLYFPLVYIQLYSIQHGIDPKLSFYSISIMNGVSGVSRIGANFLADFYRPANVAVVISLLTSVSIFLVLVVKNAASLVAVSVFYGAFSGAWLSVTLATLASMARSPSELGARVGLLLAIQSIGLLVSGPVQGALLGSNFAWWKPTVFSGTLLAVTTAIFVVIQHIMAKERGTQKV